jgi:hypothetical protein
MQWVRASRVKIVLNAHSGVAGAQRHLTTRAFSPLLQRRCLVFGKSRTSVCTLSRTIHHYEETYLMNTMDAPSNAQLTKFIAIKYVNIEHCDQ